LETRGGILDTKIFLPPCGGGQLMEEQHLSAAQVAKLVRVHYRTSENWAARGYLERDLGKYGVISALCYRLSQLEKEIGSLKDNPKAELQFQKLSAEVSERVALARIKNLEADLLESKLVDTEEVLIAWRKAIARTKAKFIAIPAKLALELLVMDEPAQIQILLNQVIHEALAELGNICWRLPTLKAKESPTNI
jgi:hypothetical protein